MTWAILLSFVARKYDVLGIIIMLTLRGGLDYNYTRLSTNNCGLLSLCTRHKGSKLLAIDFSRMSFAIKGKSLRAFLHYK